MVRSRLGQSLGDIAKRVIRECLYPVQILDQSAGMAQLELNSKIETRMDPRTGRWDVVRFEPNDVEFVLGSYTLHHDAICEVLRLSRSVSMVGD